MWFLFLASFLPVLYLPVLAFKADVPECNQKYMNSFILNVFMYQPFNSTSPRNELAALLNVSQ